MIQYIILFVTILCCSFFEVYNVSALDKYGIVKENQSKKSFAIVSVVIILFLGVFREISVGHDAEAYYIYYWMQLDRYSWHELLTNFLIDNGFFFALKSISILTDDYWCARAILFTLTFGVYYSVIRKESPYPTVSLLIFLGLANLGLMFGILRQALAGGVCLFAYKQIKKGSWLKCLILILIATTIHKSAILCSFMLLLYFLRMRKFSGVKLVVFSILAYVAFVLVIPLVISFYAESRYDGITRIDGGYGMLLFIIVVIILISHLMRVTQTNKDNELSYMFNLSCCALFVQIGALQWSLLSRTAVFFSIYWCILLPKLIYLLPKQKRLKYNLIVVVLFGFMFFYQLSDVEMFVMHQF